jgi:deoxyribonuclease-4
MSLDTAKVLGDLAKKSNISLSVHAPYFINLASEEKAKIHASIKRILDSCERAHYLGATHVVYHSGFYGKSDHKKIRDIIVENTKLIVDKVKENKWNTMIAPELTGKPSQYGSIPELLDLKENAGCEVTIDFAHQKARQQGIIDYADIFDQIKSLKHIHAHFSGIEWTQKGERNHKLMERGDILPLAQEILKRKSDITIINESPDPIGDAYKTKKAFEELK